MKILIRDILAILPEGPKVTTVYIENGVIAALDTAPAGFVPNRTILGSGRILMPGLVNAHTHVYMTLFRNCADDLTFNDWLFGRILPLEDKLTPEDCYWGTLLGSMEMLSSGTTAFSTMDFFMDATAEAAKEAGLRAVLARGLVGGEDNKEGGSKRLQEAFDALEKWHSDLISFTLAPHAPYTCDEGYQREVAAEAQRLGLRVHTHISESLSEIETIRGQYGCTPPELMDRAGLLSSNTIAAHCVHLTESDITLLAQRGVTVATCPVSNLKLANGIAPIPALLKAGAPIALGTDGASSNNTLNMFRELGLLTLLHKGTTGNPQELPARDALKIATVNGAQALGLDGVGEIKPGSKADLVIINPDCAAMQPLNDPIAALCYSASGAEVETVLVDGKILLDNRQYTTIDKDKVLFQVNRICERIGTR